MLIAVAVVGCAAGSVLLIIFSSDVVSRVVAPIVLLALVLAFINFLRLDFLITDKEISFGFGLIKKNFSRKQVLSCEEYELRFGNYLGYGIRLGRDGTVAYNTRNGLGVKITFEGAKRPYVVSIDDPHRACELLLEGSSGQVLRAGGSDE